MGRSAGAEAEGEGRITLIERQSSEEELAGWAKGVKEMVSTTDEGTPLPSPDAADCWKHEGP